MKTTCFINSKPNIDRNHGYWTGSVSEQFMQCYPLRSGSECLIVLPEIRNDGVRCKFC